ncbi:MAG: hypothetical protein Kow00109_05910 [Acidobacteriota bacterium]
MDAYPGDHWDGANFDITDSSAYALAFHSAYQQQRRIPFHHHDVGFDYLPPNPTDQMKMLDFRVRSYRPVAPHEGPLFCRQSPRT